MKLLEDHEKVLAKKDGDKEVETILGIKLIGKYHTIAVFDDNGGRGSPSPFKDKTVHEKKYEREVEE